MSSFILISRRRKNPVHSYLVYFCSVFTSNVSFFQTLLVLGQGYSMACSDKVVNKITGLFGSHENSVFRVTFVPPIIHLSMNLNIYFRQEFDI